MAHFGLSTVEFSCACKKVRGSVQVPVSSLPLPLTLCHCNICRRQSGLLAASYVTLPKEHKRFEVSGHTTSYVASKDIVRFFCGTCGSNIYVEEKIFDDISLCSGVLACSGDKTRLQSHIFVGDTKDGGMSTWLPMVQGWQGFSQKSREVDCSVQSPKRFAGDDARNAEMNENDKDNKDAKSSCFELRGYCHCQSIQFKITRPNEKSSHCRGPFADLLVPYVSSNSQTIRNEYDDKWWLRTQGSKFLAGTCACNSCRTNSGFDVQTWTFIPMVNLFNMTGEALNVEAMHGLAEHKSSEGVHRHFCSKCGATIFWRTDVRPDLVDVSVGLLDAEEGARADSWLEWWTDRVSFEEEAPNRALVESLKSGLKRWQELKTE